MAEILSTAEQLIGATPLLELRRIAREESLSCRLLAKLEYLNLSGSVKARVAESMLDDAEARALLHPGSVIIEPSSGNTGVALCAVAAARGYRCIIVMPETMSVERRRLIRAYGGELILTPGDRGMQGAIDRAEALVREIPGAFLPAQFANPANPAAHRSGTGPEIWEATGGQVDVFVAGVGTGGTLTGVGEYLKLKKPSVHIVAVEPAASPLLSGGAPGPHSIQGIGAGFLPAVLNPEIWDEVLSVTGENALAAARRMGRREGILVGISSGAALWAGLELAKRPEYAGKTLVVLLPDGGDRYLSTPLFEA